MSAISATTQRWLFVLVVLVYACAFQGTRPLYSPDEGRYTNVALNMLDSGDWLRPMLHPEVEHWAKPPLTYWSVASSIAVFGRNEFAARLPGALAFAGTVLLMMRLGRRFVPEQPWLPALTYATFRVSSAGGESRHDRHAADVVGNACRPSHSSSSGGQRRPRLRGARDCCSGSRRGSRS